MTTGRSAEIRDGLLRWRSLAPAAAALVVGAALLAGTAAHRARAENRFQRLGADHRQWMRTVSSARAERGKEPAIRRALEALEARAAPEGNLRSVFDPIVVPGKGSGVETKSVSYKVHGAWGEFEVYEIRFSASGTYPEIGRFLSRLESGRPGFVVDAVSLKKGEKQEVSAEITTRVLVR